MSSIDYIVKKAVIIIREKEFELPIPIVHTDFIDVRYHSGKTYAVREDNSHIELDSNKCLVIDYKVKK